MLTIGSLFSGVGGFDQGFHLEGFDLRWLCEIDPQAQAVLRRHYPGVTIYPNAKRMRRGTVEPVDVLIGGFPCQDLSVAGKRAGLRGKRSGLFFHLCRFLTWMRPKPTWVVLENVPGLLSSDGWRALATVQREMEVRGYYGAYRVLDLQFFRVPQRRRRVFLVFHLGDWRGPADVLFEREGLPWHPAPGGKKGQGTARILGCGSPRSGGRVGADEAAAGQLIAHTLRAEGFDASEDGTGRGTPLIPVAFDTTQITSRENRCNPQPGDPCHPLASGAHAPALAFHMLQDPISGEVSPSIGQGSTGGQSSIGALQGMAVRRLTPLECERLMGWPDDYTAWGVDEHGRRVEMSDSARYRMCGNGVGRQHGQWLAQRIKSAHYGRAWAGLPLMGVEAGA